MTAQEVSKDVAVRAEGARKGGQNAWEEARAAAPRAVVGLGASAGGLEALRQLIAGLPLDTGMAFVVIQHLDPARPSMMKDVLASVTRLPVIEASSQIRVEANRVYVIPSDADLNIQAGVLSLGPRQATGRLHLPIDSFFRALASDQQCRAIGVVLSGSGSDGTEGLRAIKAEGGITIAQAPESAQFRSMPESGVNAGVVDFQARPEEIAQALARLSKHPYIVAHTSAQEPEKSAAPGDEADYALVLAEILRRSGVDFGGYKRTTVMRRIERRMALQHTGSLRDYVTRLRGDPAEVSALAKDVLIHVTSFFRDSDAFDALKQQVLLDLVMAAQEETIRVWVPGCATGEEVYSLAICLVECREEQGKRCALKIFGSDLSDAAVETARAGVYPDSALADVSPQRLSRYFDRTGGGYRIARRIREQCIFVKHDLTRDPPFAKLDLISLRNVLIYFNADLQRRVIPMLHYCLRKRGHLFLGKSEVISTFGDLFAPVDKEHRIFAKVGESRRLAYPLEPGREPEEQSAPLERRLPAREAERYADHLLLTRFSPPGVLVDERFEVVQFRGRTGAFLESPPGHPERNVVRMARDGLAAHLYEALERAKARSATVRQEHLRIQIESSVRIIDLEVIPLTRTSGVSESFFLILFHEHRSANITRSEPAAAPGSEGGAEREETLRLKSELVATKDYLQALVAEHQVTADDLAAANEELVAGNEELQSTNEELQSAKEELQSANEELSTLNDELRNRNADLDQVANDLVNVLASVEIPVIIVDLELKVRRFTPAIRKIASFIPEDVGRSIDDLKLKVKVENLTERVLEVIRDLAPKEWEVEAQDGRWFRMQIRPYRTTEDRLNGAVLSFVDINALKRALEDAERARDSAKNITEAVATALLVLNERLEVASANRAFYQRFGLGPSDVDGRSCFELGSGAWNDPTVQTALREAVDRHTPFANLVITADFPRVGRRIVSLSGRAIQWSGAAMTLLAVEDITELRALEFERRQLLESEKRARHEAESANRAKDLFLATLSHELRTPLSTMLMQAQLLKKMASEDAKLERASAAIERSARTQARLIEDLLDVSRIVSGKLMLDLAAVDLDEIVHTAADVAAPAAEAKGLEFRVEAEHPVGMIYGDAVRLQQVVSNLLTNAIKFTPRGGRVVLSLERVGETAVLTVSDNGMGIRAETLPHLFANFVQADSSVTRAHGGLGLGLAIVRHLVEVHGGRVEAESAGEGQGATFRVSLPLGTSLPRALGGAARTVAREIRGVRVLLVEDEDDAREAFAAMLTQLGAEVYAASSAAAGLSALERFRPHVIISDIAMPGGDGYSFIRKVRSLGPERCGEVPAAALTALASDEDRKRALEAGFQMHLAKPIDAVRLAAAIGTLAAAGRPSSAA